MPAGGSSFIAAPALVARLADPRRKALQRPSAPTAGREGGEALQMAGQGWERRLDGPRICSKTVCVREQGDFSPAGKPETSPLNHRLVCSRLGATH